MVDTMTPAKRAATISGGGRDRQRPEGELVGPAEQQRGIQLPQLLVSLMVVAVSALLILWWNTSTSAREPVLALANDIPAGQVIDESDLVTVFVSADSPIETTSEQFVGVFVGAVARTDFEAGTLVVDKMFRESVALGADEALVGLLLSANQYPPGLVPGDAVEVLVLNAPAELVRSAVVESVSASSGNAWMRVRVAREDAEILQRAAAANQVAVFEVAQ